jgi:hypothetical protein
MQAKVTYTGLEPVTFGLEVQRATIAPVGRTQNSTCLGEA